MWTLPRDVSGKDWIAHRTTPRPRSRSLEQNGKEVSLESLLKKGPVAVVFHRSVDWCLYCKLQMVQLQRIRKEIEAAGGQVVGISYDPVEKLKRYRQPQQDHFPTALGCRQQDH